MDLKSMTLQEMQEYMESIGEKKFRAKQIYEWFHKHLALSLDEMNNVPKKLKEKNEEKKEGRYLRREFSYSKFQQTMVLPENAEKEKIEAKVENGVLNIIIPKMSEEAAKKAEKIIEIK